MTNNTFNNMPDSDIKEGDVFVAQESKMAFKMGSEYTVIPATCSCCTWALQSDDGTNYTHKDMIPVFIKKDTMAEADRPVREMPILPLGLMWDTDRTTLVLAKFNGKRIQQYTDGVWSEYTGNLDNKGTYRLTPQAVIDTELRRELLLSRINAIQNSL
jgi:hypothetical protein